MRHLIVAMLLLVALTAAAAVTETEADRWNLADLYASLDAWNADAGKLTAQMTEFAACKGHLGDSAARLKQCLKLRYDMQKRNYRLGVYAGEQLAADTGVPASLELDQRGDALGNALGEADAFVDPEILALGKARIDALLAADAGLASYRFPLDHILRAAPHTLDAEGEMLVASFGQMNDAGRSTYSVLFNSDIPWPTINLADGELAKLDSTGYEKYREVVNRGDRKRVMETFFGTFKMYERTFGVTYYAQMKQAAVYAKVRKYPDSITAALDRNAIPVSVFDTLIAQTNASLPTLHRYFRLRAKMLGITDMHYYDIYPPLVHGDFKFPYATGRALILDAVAPLGKDYVAALRNGLDSRWMDIYPRPHKESGAHMAGDAYDVHPYVLLNYIDNYDSVTGTAHEWGHAMHTYLSNRAQPFATANYANFVAEIASTFNEALLIDRMIKTARTDDERLFYLGTALEGLRGGFYRQAMFAEFERNVHARVDRGEALTGDAMTRTYCEILKRYHGDAEGVVKVDDVDCVEWAFIPHFYTPYYVYQYATSLAASSLFAQRVTGREPGALDRYLTLLKSGASDYPYELVKKAGVDLATPAPYQALVARMDSIMDRMEALLAQRK